MTRRAHSIDNRDMVTTWLWIEDKNEYIEIDPWDLVENVLDNMPLPGYVRTTMKQTLEDMRTEIEVHIDEAIEDK